DTPDYCEPNRSFECYTFSISRGGPEARIIEPLPETYSACVPQAVVMSLTDRNGIDTSTIILVVQGDTFDISSPELSYEEPYLRFEPTVPFFDGETVYVELVSARDNLFNPLDSALSWHFVMDLSSPVIANIVPAPDSIVDVRQPRISFSLFDELSGLDQSSIRIEIGSNVFVPGARGTSWNGRDFVFYPESLGIFWRGGDRIDICVHAADRPHYCEPNMLDTCWAIYIATGGPIATVIEPLNRTISTCRDQRIVVRLWDRDGVNLSTVRIMVDTVLYTLDSVGVLEYRADTLIFTPRSGQWRDSDTVFVALLAAEDNLGNPLERAPVRWSFMLDFSPPMLVYNYPTDMSYVTNWQDSIVGRFVDNLLGVDSSSFVLTLTGVFMHRDPIFFGFGDRGLRWTGSGFIFSPRDIDQTRFGITYPYELEGFSGLYFAEFETIGVSLYIADNPPNYCEPNPVVYGFRFVVADDDTLPPEFIEFSPSYYSWNMPFYITVVVTDSSGVYEYGAYLIWDDDGSVDDGSFSLVALVVDSVIDSYTIRFRTLEPIPAQRIGADFVYRVFAYDNDYDFLNPRDRMLGSAYGMVRILEGPYAYPVEPLPNTVTSCSDQSIIIRLVDSDGVDERSILLKINDSLFTIEDPRLSYIGDSLLIFDPEDGYFANEQVVQVELVQALDNLGNPRFDTLRFTFAVDLEPPQFVFTFPGDSGMVHDPTMPIEILVTDNLSGVNLDSLVLIANGRTYRIGTGLRFIGNRVIFTPSAGVFRSGDTISVAIYAADSPDYCLPNASSASWIYIIEPSVPCDAHPNPFTPNSDGYNDIVIFNYPNMFSQDAELIIYNRWNEEIIRKSLYRVRDFFTISKRFWDGKDKTGKPVQPGVYIYVIKMRGEIVCSGTITVAR
ncbi:MAG: gliding motility-associated C-terminal domain-containing protein, partial [Halobacteria archaeon]